MPIWDEEYQFNYATEDELLAFANKLRKAGDADPLEALMPSETANAEACLIANAVNYQSRVQLLHDSESYGSIEDKVNVFAWIMVLPENVDADRVRKIAEAVDCEVVEAWDTIHHGFFTTEQKRYEDEPANRGKRLVIRLPEVIGNTAHAFDLGRGWTKNYDKALG